MDVGSIFTAVQLVAAVITGGALVLSGLTKVRDTDATRETFDALGVPAFVTRFGGPQIYPWAELVVGVGVLVAPAFVWWPLALIALAILVTLLVLVARVVARADAVSCNCFGTRESVSSRTVIRNSIFVALAALPLLRDPAAASPVWIAAAGAPALLVGVILAAALAAVLTVLSRGAGTPADEVLPAGPVAIPDVDVKDGSDVVSLTSIVSQGPVLLVYVKTGCGSCETVLAKLNDGQLIATRVRIRLIEREPAGGIDPERARIWDTDGAAAKALGIRSTPGAALLSADGTMPTPPVYGSTAVLEFVAEIEEAVASTLSGPAS